MSDDYGIRTPFGDSLALQTLSYRCMGHDGQDEDKPLASDEIPSSLRKLRRVTAPCGCSLAVLRGDPQRTVREHMAECREDGETDDDKYNDPHHWQAEHINRENGKS